MDLKRREVSVDQALQHVGELGHFQHVQTALCALAWAVSAAQTSLVLLSTLGSSNPQAYRLIKCNSNPATNKACEAALAQPYPSGLCSLPHQDSWHWNVPRGYSLVTEFDLVCDRSWLAALPAVSFFTGAFLATIFCHFVSENISRRRLLTSGLLLTGVAGIMAATAPFLWSLSVFRAASGAGVALISIASFLLAADVVGPSWRPFAGVFLHGGFSLGAATGAVIAWAVPGWRLATLLVALFPLFTLLLATTSLLVESPDWLLMSGRKGEATATIAAIAFANRTRPPEYALADPTAVLANPHRGVSDVFRSPRLRRRTALLCTVWSLATFAYYASALLVDAIGSGDPSGDGSALEIAMAGFAYEIPGVAAAALAVERLGRRRTVFAGLSMAGAALSVAAGAGPGAWQRGLAAGARFGLACACSALYVLSWEAFPVVVQKPGMAVVTYTVRLAAMLAPVLAFSVGLLTSASLPLLVCGVLCCIAAAIAVVLLPETLGVAVCETILEFNAAAQVKRPRHSWAHYASHSSRSGGIGSNVSVSVSGVAMRPQPTGAVVALPVTSLLSHNNGGGGSLGGGGGPSTAV